MGSDQAGTMLAVFWMACTIGGVIGVLLQARELRHQSRTLSGLQNTLEGAHSYDMQAGDVGP